MPRKELLHKTYFDSREREVRSENPRLFMVEYTVAEGGKLREGREN